MYAHRTRRPERRCGVCSQSITFAPDYLPDHMFLYSFFRPFAKYAIATYYRKIYLTGTEHIPTSQPMILASNHPTAFTEPAGIACWQNKRELYFLVRGDFFGTKFTNWALRSFNMLPIFRAQDGTFEQRKTNIETFNQTYRDLAQGKAVMVLVEGRTKMAKRLGKIQKGAARMAFGTIDRQPDADILIVPTGVNYSNGTEFRSIVMIECGAPIRVRDYYELYQENGSRAVKELCDEMGRRMAERMVIVEREEDDWLANTLMDLSRHELEERMLPLMLPDDRWLRNDQQIARGVNEMSSGERKSLTTDLRAYLQKLKDLDVTDFGLLRPENATFGRLLIVVLGFLPALVGLVFNFLPIYVTYWIGKNKIKAKEFKASIWTAGPIGTLLIWYILFGVLFMVLFGWWQGLLVALGFLALGAWAVQYYDYARFYQMAARAKRLSTEQREALIREHRELVSRTSPGYA